MTRTHRRALLAAEREIAAAFSVPPPWLGPRCAWLTADDLYRLDLYRKGFVDTLPEHIKHALRALDNPVGHADHKHWSES